MQILVLLLFLVFAGCNGCATDQSSTGDTNDAITQYGYYVLNTAGVSYDSLMKSARDLYDKGYLKDEGKAKIIEYGTKYKAAYDGCVAALESYKKVSDAESAAKLTQAISEVVRFLGEITGYLQPFFEKEKAAAIAPTSQLLFLPMPNGLGKGVA